MNNKKTSALGLYGIKLLVYSLVLLAFLYFVSTQKPDYQLDLSQGFYILFFALLTFLTHFLLTSIGTGDKGSFIRAFLASIVFKLIFTIIFVSVLMLISKENLSSRLILVAILYALYTIFEVSSLVSYLKG